MTLAIRLAAGRNDRNQVTRQGRSGASPTRSRWQLPLTRGMTELDHSHTSAQTTMTLVGACESSGLRNSLIPSNPAETWGQKLYPRLLLRKPHHDAPRLQRAPHAHRRSRARRQERDESQAVDRCTRDDRDERYVTVIAKIVLVVNVRRGITNSNGERTTGRSGDRGRAGRDGRGRGDRVYLAATPAGEQVCMRVEGDRGACLAGLVRYSGGESG